MAYGFSIPYWRRTACDHPAIRARKDEHRRLAHQRIVGHEKAGPPLGIGLARPVRDRAAVTFGAAPQIGGEPVATPGADTHAQLCRVGMHQRMFDRGREGLEKGP
jgi:hypothetical protein